MLIRNAVIDGYSGPVDLRLMHGAVQEIGVGLQKGLYESELDLMGDGLSPCPPEMALPRRYRRRAGEAAHIVPGAREPFLRVHEGVIGLYTLTKEDHTEPFLRVHEGVMVGLIDSHTAD